MAIETLGVNGNGKRGLSPKKGTPSVVKKARLAGSGTGETINLGAVRSGIAKQKRRGEREEKADKASYTHYETLRSFQVIPTTHHSCR